MEIPDVSVQDFSMRETGILDTGSIKSLLSSIRGKSTKSLSV